MSEYLIAIYGGLAATFASLVASFSGGGLSLILFPILLLFSKKIGLEQKEKREFTI